MYESGNSYNYLDVSQSAAVAVGLIAIAAAANPDFDINGLLTEALESDRQNAQQWQEMINSIKNND